MLGKIDFMFNIGTKFLRSLKKIFRVEVTCEMFTEFITLKARLMKAVLLKMRKNP